MSNQIAVTTPTGNVGSALVRRLVQAGERPIVLARDPGRLDPAFAGHVEAWQGDLSDAGFVNEALAGVDALYLVIPEVLSVDDPEAVAQQLADTVLSAVESADVRRVVLQSSVGAERREGAGFISLLGRVEEQLDALAARTGLEVCHLRAGYFFSNLLMDVDALRAGTLAMGMPADQPMPWVAPDDIAGVAAGRLLSSSWTGRVVQAVHGPAHLTPAEVVAIISAATGWSVSYVRTDDEAVRSELAAAGMSEAAIASIVGMTTGLRDGFVPEQQRDLSSTTSTALSGWVYRTLGPGAS